MKEEMINYCYKIISIIQFSIDAVGWNFLLSILSNSLNTLVFLAARLYVFTSLLVLHIPPLIFFGNIFTTFSVFPIPPRDPLWQLVSCVQEIIIVFTTNYAFSIEAAGLDFFKDVYVFPCCWWYQKNRHWYDTRLQIF